MNDLKQLPDDEFDIEVLASKLWRIFKRAMAKIYYPFKVAISNRKKLYLSLAVAVTLSVILRYTLPPVFETTFIIKPNMPTDMVALGMLDDLNLMVKDDNYEDLANSLQLPAELCEEIVRINSFPIFKNEFRKDTVSAIQVNLLLLQPRLIDTLQHAIMVNYLEKSTYFNKVIHIRQQELDYMENSLLEDIVENDSLKQVVTSNVSPKSGGGFVYGQPLDPQKVYQSGYELNKQLLQIRSSKQFNTSFILAKPGMVRLKPYFPRLIILLPIFTFLAFGYCLVSNLKAKK